MKKTKKTRRTIRDLELENAELKGRVAALEATVQKLVTTPNVQYIPYVVPQYPYPLYYYQVLPYVQPDPWLWCKVDPCAANPMPFGTGITLQVPSVWTPKVNDTQFGTITGVSTTTTVLGYDPKATVVEGVAGIGGVNPFVPAPLDFTVGVVDLKPSSSFTVS